MVSVNLAELLEGGATTCRGGVVRATEHLLGTGTLDEDRPLIDLEAGEG